VGIASMTTTLEQTVTDVDAAWLARRQPITLGTSDLSGRKHEL